MLLDGPFPERRRLVLDAVPHVDAQLGGAGSDNRMLLSGQDQHRHAGLAQQANAHAVAAVDAHPLVALVVDLGAAIDQRCDGLGERELLDAVDLDRP